MAHKAGLPPGTVNVVTTSRCVAAPPLPARGCLPCALTLARSPLSGGRALAPEVGLVLSTSPTVRKLSFTGSTAVGKQLAAQSASTVKRVSLELGA